MSNYRKVLNLYKQLYKTRLQIFQDDTDRLKYTLNRMRNDFRANKDITDQAKIKELIRTGKEVDRLLKNSIIQTVKTPKDNIYRVRVKDYMIQDNHCSNK